MAYESLTLLRRALFIHDPHAHTLADLPDPTKAAQIKGAYRHLSRDLPSSQPKAAAHSTRIGAAHDLAASGIDLTSIMHSGGWNDPKMPRYYTRELAARESGMARMMKARVGVSE